jgi:hypothetical protein
MFYSLRLLWCESMWDKIQDIYHLSQPTILNQRENVPQCLPFFILNLLIRAERVVGGNPNRLAAPCGP